MHEVAVLRQKGSKSMKKSILLLSLFLLLFATVLLACTPTPDSSVVTDTITEAPTDAPTEAPTEGETQTPESSGTLTGNIIGPCRSLRSLE